MIVCGIVLLGCKKHDNNTDNQSNRIIIQFPQASAQPKEMRDSEFTPLITNQPVKTDESNADESAYPLDTVLFKDAHVSLNPGDEWQQLTNGYFAEVQSICAPVLEGVSGNRGGLIQVFSSGSSKDAGTVADALERIAASNTALIPSTFKKNYFLGINHIKGFQISYNYKTTNLFRTNELVAHVYIFNNHLNECIILNYTTLVMLDFGLVEQMIRDTLKLN